MPADNTIIIPREGHIDVIDGLLDAGVSISVEVVDDPVAGVITIMHADVSRGGDVEAPFSVGVPLTAGDLTRLLSAMSTARDAMTGGNRDRMN